ncbi:hypothetical protein [Sagittula sp. SSi028]|uniref:TolB family protein n=1 Tax=Sagittula sp. SSi028 TaxID=3400636 RepID=UPI003AF4DC41
MVAELCIHTLSTGISRSLWQGDLHLEAPNWSPDGRSLIVNGDGRLYRFDLDTEALTQIDTGRHDRLNNDHGPSPDGTKIAFCDKVDTGKSCIYTLTLDKGSVDRITPNVPSWFHAWSPDGRRMTYTAVRDGQFGIFTCAADGRDERCLVTSAHHYDGPDYTPDGAWIWFNSARGGPASDLWRIRTDGTGLQQMTHSDRVEWFPHPSPDGAHVLYLSYPEGTQGHPFGMDVELRLMPAQGGAPVTIEKLYGGQGSLNVPCWAPDGHAFAYMRYHR